MPPPSGGRCIFPMFNFLLCSIGVEASPQSGPHPPPASWTDAQLAPPSSTPSMGLMEDAHGDLVRASFFSSPFKGARLSSVIGRKCPIFSFSPHSRSFLLLRIERRLGFFFFLVFGACQLRKRSPFVVFHFESSG